MEFNATDQSSNVFNPGDLLSRSLGGSVNFGVSGTQVTMIAAIAAAAVVLFFVFKKK